MKNTLAFSVCFIIIISSVFSQEEEYLSSGFKSFKRNNFDSAVYYINKAIKLNPENAKAYFLRASAFDQSGKYSNAKDDYLTCIKKDSTYPNAYFSLAVMLREKTSEYDDAKTYFLKYLKLKADNAVAHFYLANLLNEKFQDYEGAKEQYLMAINIYTAYEEARYSLALLYENRLNSYDDARKQYEELLRIDPEHANAQFAYAMLLKDRYKDMEGAKEHYIKATTDHIELINPELDKFFNIVR